MDPIINLSYIITTRNRLPFLKITLERLISGLQHDEEIVVVDSESTDGSKEYLKQLLERSKIQQFISEPDKNQAHGWNKAMLLAKGILIKKIIDDDVFCYDAIRKCKLYMLQNPQVDIVISNDLSSELKNHQTISRHSRLPQFENWRKASVPSFTFGDVHMLIRRGSLAYIGLYNILYTMMDWEFSLRASYLKANISYYTGYNALSVAHPQTVTSSVNKPEIKEQGKQAAILYAYAGDDSEISYWSKLKIFIGKAIYKPTNTIENNNINHEIDSVYGHYYHVIAEINKGDGFTFIGSC
ncbi:glycosyltransferase [Mucilaginibacter sp. UR6-11]|uniref:glycosyltransferase n=1 Tax=Mucilaginibacter sp. UR6-11 TaxID=1435644 RepID=UPI001E39A467|nr:glycosyltransferase [Mucilaginibacter sp. UR6-11]MCC8425728.1 glycosyltransferase [Mucilaginibacter sp. UR6-11]